MKAVQIKNGKGSADDMFIGDDVEVPEPKDGQALVKVYAFGINRMDLIQRSSSYPLPPGTTPILGVEFSGVIEKLGAGASVAHNGSDTPGFEVGDRVFGLIPGGAYAEYAVCDYRTMLKMPHGISFNEAAAIPENWFTAIQVVRLVGDFKKRDKVLVHAGASGIGVAVIQLAQILGARRVFTTVGSKEKSEFIKNKLTLTGALPDEIVPINYHEEKFAEVVKKYDPEGIQLIIDTIGANYLEGNIEALALDGRLVEMGLMSGTKAEIDLGKVLYKRLKISGTTLRSRSPEYQQVLRDFFYEQVQDKVGNHKVNLFIDKVYNWKDVAEAHKHMEANKNMGKIICTVVSQPFEQVSS